MKLNFPKGETMNEVRQNNYFTTCSFEIGDLGELPYEIEIDDQIILIWMMFLVVQTIDELHNS